MVRLLYHLGGGQNRNLSRKIRRYPTFDNYAYSRVYVESGVAKVCRIDTAPRVVSSPLRVVDDGGSKAPIIVLSY